MDDAKIERWRAAVERDPTDELAWFTLARACLEAGRPAEARDHFRAALARQPDWMMAHVLLGRACADLGDRAAAREAFLAGRRLAEAQGHGEATAEIDDLLEDLDA